MAAAKPLKVEKKKGKIMLSFPTVHDGNTLVDIAKDARFFS
jgi:hypothetical protein